MNCAFISFFLIVFPLSCEVQCQKVLFLICLSASILHRGKSDTSVLLDASLATKEAKQIQIELDF